MSLFHPIVYWGPLAIIILLLNNLVFSTGTFQHVSNSLMILKKKCIISFSTLATLQTNVAPLNTMICCSLFSGCYYHLKKICFPHVWMSILWLPFFLFLSHMTEVVWPVFVRFLKLFMMYMVIKGEKWCPEQQETKSWCSKLPATNTGLLSMKRQKQP